MINLFYVSTEIFLSLSILILLLIGVFKNKSELFIYNFTCIILLVGLAININFGIPCDAMFIKLCQTK